MFEIEVFFSLPDVNNDPINRSCVEIVLEVEWEGDGEFEHINVRRDEIPSNVCDWLSAFYEVLYNNDDTFRAQIDAAIQKDIEWVKSNNFVEPYE